MLMSRMTSRLRCVGWQTTMESRTLVVPRRMASAPPKQYLSTSNGRSALVISPWMIPDSTEAVRKTHPTAPMLSYPYSSRILSMNYKESTT